MNIVPKLSGVASYDLGIDGLLMQVCKALELTDTQYDEMTEKYRAVGKWLGAADSPLALYKPAISPQGAAAIQTLNKPRKQDEFDIDLICELTNLQPTQDAMAVYELVEQRLSDNEVYRPKLERFKRCIRINYAGQFHLDITPACPNPYKGTPHLLVPDRNLQSWKSSNPRGFAHWFNSRSMIGTKTATRKIDPVPENLSAEDKPPLKNIAQLLKRNRDVVFEQADNAPRSIALTTLSGIFYTGASSIITGLTGVLDEISRAIANTNGIIDLRNPTDNQESFSEAWVKDPASYKAFIAYVHNLRAAFISLQSLSGLDRIAAKLSELFGEEVVTRAVRAHVERMNEHRGSGQLALVGSSLLIGTGSARAIPRTTFFGN